MNDEIAQIKTILGESKKPLIVLAENPSHDAIASSLGLYLLCMDLKKNPTIVSHNFASTKPIEFLPKINLISPNLVNLQNYLISIEIPEDKIDTVDHFHKNNKLNISLRLKEGSIKTENIKFGSSKFNYDIIFTLDAENLETLGKIYEKNLDFFYHTPIVNIDHKPENTRFGQINLVDLSATSISEIIYNIFNENEQIIDEDISTYFLTGIISKTKSFKTENITPRTLDIAGRLISMGAKREKIVNNLYKQQTVPILKLWGRALAGLKHDDNIGLVWSVLSRQDFIKAGADAKHLPDVIDELIINSPEAKLVLFIYEDSDSICCLLRAGRNFDLKKLAMNFNEPYVIINNEIKFCVTDKDLIKSEKWVVDEVRKLVL
ncbi:MAG: hypothetical protein U9P90_02890 [Patescibacteria group bacterium]|nr:hypothetical protein [Patescibacteria group bacterium]